jgi:serine protease Do
MIRSRLIGAWLGLAMLAWPVVAPALIDRETLFALSVSVVRIEAPRRGGGFSLGSGVVVAPDKVVTNCHVTRDAMEVEAVRGDTRWRAQAQIADVVRDLCLLHVPGVRLSPVRLGRSTDIALGQSVTALGFTGGVGIQQSAGQVVEVHRHDGARVLQSDNWFSSGASGGGLFDDDGRLVGVLTFRLRGGEQHYFSVPVEWVAELLARPDDQYARVRPLDGPAAPFWLAEGPGQPRFLRAALLIRNDRWDELLSVATEWARVDPSDAEPWFLMGTALARQNRLPEARAALECSLDREPGLAAARERLAAVTARQPVTVAAAPATTTPC